MLRYLWVILLWAVLYLPWLGADELKGEEGRRILPARAMIQEDQYIVPYSEGKPYHRKPPLVNWLIAASFRIHGGESLWAARLPTALSVLGLALLALRAGRTWCSAGGNSVARHFPLALAAVILTSGGLLEKGRLAEIDGLYTALFGMGFLCWAAAWRRGAESWSLWLPAACFLGLGILAKGPVYLPFYYIIAALTLHHAGKLRLLVTWPHLASLALTFAIPLPWVMASSSRMAGLTVAGAPPQGQVWWQQLSDRLAPEAWNAGAWALSPLETFVSFCPVVIVVAVLWIRLRRRAVQEAPRQDRALLTGLGRGVLISGLLYALIPEPHARFQLPLLTPLALLLVLLAAIDRHDPLQTPLSWRLFSTGAAILLLGLTIAGSVLPFLPGYAMMQPGFLYASIAGFLAWIAFISMRRLAFPLRFIGEMTVLISMAMLLHITIMRLKRATEEENRPPALEILAATGPGARIMAFYAGPQHFLYYLGPETREAISVTALTEDTTHIVITEKKWEEPETRKKFAARGFRRELVRVTDRENKRYVTVARGD